MIHRPTNPSTEGKTLDWSSAPEWSINPGPTEYESEALNVPATGCGFNFDAGRYEVESVHARLYSSYDSNGPVVSMTALDDGDDGAQVYLTLAEATQLAAHLTTLVALATGTDYTLPSLEALQIARTETHGANPVSHPAFHDTTTSAAAMRAVIRDLVTEARA